MNKSDLLQVVYGKLSEKIRTLEQLIADTRAANNETKSSMGDKYETSREMVQQEINKLQLQLNDSISARNSLASINVSPHETIAAGSLVKTQRGLFFIAVPVGEIVFGNEKIFVLSPESPLATAMWGKKTGDSVLVNHTEHNIIQIR